MDIIAAIVFRTFCRANLSRFSDLKPRVRLLAEIAEPRPSPIAKRHTETRAKASVRRLDASFCSVAGSARLGPRATDFNTANQETIKCRNNFLQWVII
jgi:hypothetical protein